MHLLTGQSDGIMPVLLSDEEIYVLSELSPLNAHIYIFGIRRYMDYKTGIVGIKRGISYQSLAETGSTNEEQGRHKTKCKKLTRDIIRRSLETLEKKGLIKRESIRTKDKKKLILSCVLARTDLSHAKYDDAMMTLADDTNDDTKKNLKNTINNRLKQEYKSYDDANDDALKNRMMTLPPVSGKDCTVVDRAQQKTFVEIEDYLIVFENAGCDRTNFGNTRAIEMLRAFKRDGVLLEDVRTVLEAEKLKTGGLLNAPLYYQKQILRARKDREQILQKAEEVKNEPVRQQRQPYEDEIATFNRLVDEAAAAAKK